MYKMTGFEKGTTFVQGRLVTSYVAIISREDSEEPPYRILLDNFNTKEEALEQINRWIAAREADDKNALEESEAAKQEEEKDSIMDSIKADL